MEAIKKNQCGAMLRICLLSMQMTYPILRHVLVVSTMLLYTSSVLADALVRSEAMFADTIAEYYVEDDHIRLELEIGSNDVGAFRNLLPDGLYQHLDLGGMPLKDRLPLFVTEDMPARVVMVKKEIFTQLFFRDAVAVIVCLVGIYLLNAHQHCAESYVSGPIE
jgi:hypothetical protein